MPRLNLLTSSGWRLSWLVLGLIVVLIGGVCFLLLRDHPHQVGLGQVGEEPGAHTPSSAFPPVPFSLILHSGLLYFVFGFTFVTYATFIVTTMVQQQGVSQATAGSFWSWVGLFSIFSGPVFGTLSDKTSRRFGLIVVFSIQTLAYLLAGLHSSTPVLLLSIFCYGIVAFSIPSIMSALAGDYAGPERTVAMFSAITFLFALGQVSGPFVAGFLAQVSGDFSSAYLLSAAMTGLAAFGAGLLPSPQKNMCKSNKVSNKS